MNLTMFLFQQPEAAAEAPKVGVGMLEKVGGTIGLVFCIVLGAGAAIMYVVMSISALMRRFADKEVEKQWEREHVPGGGAEGGSFPGVRYGFMSFLVWAVVMITPGFIPTTWGYDTWKEYGRTFVPRLLGTIVFYVVAGILGAIGGVFLGMADGVKTTTDAAAAAAKLTEVSYPASYTIFTLIGGLFLGAMMVVPILVAAFAFKGLFKKQVDEESPVVDVDPGTKSQLWSEWLRDKVWVERKQSRHFAAVLKPALVVYALMVVGTLIVYAFVAIFIPAARDVGFPFSSGGPYWLLLLIPPMVCAPPFLPLFASLLLGVPLRRKIREGGGVAS